jgi:hypothetical protein
MIDQLKLNSSFPKKINDIRVSTNLFLQKLQVIADSRAIIYSIRILIIVTALLMGYIHTPKKENKISIMQQKELKVKNSSKQIPQQ